MPVSKSLTETIQIPEKFIVDLIRRKNEGRIELAVLVVNKSMTCSQGSKKEIRSWSEIILRAKQTRNRAGGKQQSERSPL